MKCLLGELCSVGEYEKEEDLLPACEREEAHRVHKQCLRDVLAFGGITLLVASIFDGKCMERCPAPISREVLLNSFRILYQMVATEADVSALMSVLNIRRHGCNE